MYACNKYILCNLGKTKLGLMFGQENLVRANCEMRDQRICLFV